MAAGVDFFVSYNHSDTNWAEWIAWQLEDSGYSVIIQKWDFSPGSNFVLEMQKAAASAQRTICVVSENYLQSKFTKPEWAAALTDDPDGELRKLLLVRIVDCEVPGLLKSVVQIRLEGQPEDDARRILLDGVAIGRRKPKLPPDFPGTKSTPANVPSFPGKLPKIWNVPFRRNQFFAGRDKLVSRLRTTAIQNRASSDSFPLTISGLGGVGKTQLIAQFVWMYRAEFEAVIWVSCDANISLSSKIASLAEPGILDLPQRFGGEDGDKLAEVLKWMRCNHKWLIVFDSVDDAESIDSIKSILPTDLPGTVVITSRVTDWPVGFDVVCLDTLSRADAVEFLVGRTSLEIPIDNINPSAFDIAERLGDLPLALEQAGAYIVRNRISFDEYKGLLEKASSSLLGSKSEGGTSYQHTVSTTWKVTIDKLSHLARTLLRLVCLFAQTSIPREVFTNNRKKITSALSYYSSIQRDSLLPETEINAALAELAQYSLVELRQSSVTCHSLLQTVERESIQRDEIAKWGELALQLLIETARHGPDVSSDLSLTRTLLPHFQFILETLDIDIAEDTSSYARFWCGVALKELGNFREADAALRKTLDFLQGQPEIDGVAIYSVKNHLGQVLYEMGRADEAEVILRDSLNLMELQHGKDSPNSIGILVNLGACIGKPGRIEEAREILSHALDLSEKEYGTLSPSLASVLGNLAHTEMYAGEFALAETILRRALNLVENKPENQRVRLSLVSNLGNLLTGQYRLSESEPFLREAVNIAKDAYGSEHWWYGRALNNLGLLLHDTKSYDEAETILLLALEISKQTYGPEHVETAISYNNLGRIYRETKRPEKAEAYYDMAIRIYRNCKLDRGHGIAAVYANKGFCLADQSRMSESEAAFREALEIDTQVFGIEHVEVAADMGNLGGILMEQKKYALADPLLRKSLKLFSKILGKNSRITVGARLMLDDLQVRRKHFRSDLTSKKWTGRK